MFKKDYRYSTDSLLVCEWHAISSDDWNPVELERVVIDILTPGVTRSLPPDWQGAYSHQRAERWIRERDAESTTLIVIQKATGNAIGLLILFGTADGSRDLRLGYLLAEAAWGQGFASELVRGLVDWSTANDISTLTGGVESGNIASRRVLEKNGFVADLASNGSDEQMFVLKIS